MRRHVTVAADAPTQPLQLAQYSPLDTEKSGAQLRWAGRWGGGHSTGPTVRERMPTWLQGRIDGFGTTLTRVNTPGDPGGFSAGRPLLLLAWWVTKLTLVPVDANKPPMAGGRPEVQHPAARFGRATDPDFHRTRVRHQVSGKAPCGFRGLPMRRRPPRPGRAENGARTDRPGAEFHESTTPLRFCRRCTTWRPHAMKCRTDDPLPNAPDGNGA